MLSICLESGRQQPAYVRLFDRNFQKDKIDIQLRRFQDPTIGLPWGYEDLLDSLVGATFEVNELYIYSPALPAVMDLFTIHVYEQGDREEEFDHLKIYPVRKDPYQAQVDIVLVPCQFALTERTRVSFILPAFSRCVLDFMQTGFWPDIEAPELSEANDL